MRSKHNGTEEIVENSVSSFNNHMRYGGPMVFSSEDNDICDEEDVLVDVPSNGSFPQAELLHMI